MICTQTVLIRKKISPQTRYLCGFADFSISIQTRQVVYLT